VFHHCSAFTQIFGTATLGKVTSGQVEIVLVPKPEVIVALPLSDQSSLTFNMSLEIQCVARFETEEARQWCRASSQRRRYKRDRTYIEQGNKLGLTIGFNVLDLPRVLVRLR
jgi:hypothetical protein